MRISELPYADQRFVIFDESKGCILVSCMRCNKLAPELEAKGIMCHPCFRICRRNSIRNFPPF